MKLAEALSFLQKANKDGTPYPLLLACGFTPLHLQTFLSAHLQAVFTRRNICRQVRVMTGLYGSLTETMEQMASFQYEAAVLFIEWADLDPRLGYRSLGGWGSSADASLLSSAEATLARLASSIAHKPASFRLVVSLPTLNLPPGFHTVGSQTSVEELALEGAVTDFARKIAQSPSVLILNREKLAAVSPAVDRYDFRSDLNAGFPYSLRHTDVLAEGATGLLVPETPKKALISDLDGTLWRGIVGEDGPNGVAWDLAGHAQIHGLYQQMLQCLADHGVLIGVASKNDAATAEEPLRRSDLVVKREKIFPMEIHWEAKSGSVTRILKVWNIAADSVVFVDDSAMELAEVQAAHPGIECILFPGNDYPKAFAMLRQLRDLFGKPALSKEDSFRMESIRNSQVFINGAGEEDLAERFLASAEAVVTFDLNPAADDARVLELVNKTNQFNLNGKRYTEAEWSRAASAPGAFVVTVSYQDRFGPLGKIAVVNGRKENDTVMIEAWVLSCRAFSRRIEHQTLQQIFEKTGAKQVSFAYSSTAKNGPVQEFLSQLLNAEVPAMPVISEAAFAARCPALYHQVAFSATDQESSWITQNSV